MKIRSPQHHSQGFTLLEMITVVAILGIVLGFAVPSFLSMRKPLRDGVNQFTAQLALIRTKAIASNQSYRIRPKYATAAQYLGANGYNAPRSFIVEYAANCQVDKYGYGLANSSSSATPERPYNTAYPNGLPDGWMMASQFDLDLPPEVGISDITGAVKVNGTATSSGTQTFTKANAPSTSSSVTYDANLNWSICYDNRGLAYRTVEIIFKDYQGNNQAKTATINVMGVGSVAIKTYSNTTATGTALSNSSSSTNSTLIF